MPKSSLLEKVLFPPVRLHSRKLALAAEGKTILITGASSGIGEQLAYLLAPCRAHLILVARRADKLNAMKQHIEREQAKVSVYSADLRNEDEMAELLSNLNGLPDGLDIIVSNAGLSIKRSIWNSLDRHHDFKRTMAINYLAPVQLLLSALPELERRKGHIINVSTINASLLPIPHWSAYQASKSAFDVWLRSIAPELNAKGIATTSIYLPLVRTPMILPTEAYRNMPAMSAVHAAQTIAKSMYTRRAKYAPWWLFGGQLASVLLRGAWDKVAPALLRRRR
ncbi:SDR family NAD(P)-dependent oxidoreductase [Paenibacillus sp. NEAU-GSW1]|uniref:SDR family NAD(P)-dependent oxidoreductase n=1 Tax=Paenibacillus sp. NEAU-GSW1 TaxID=2682486 RepID=UPI0012E1B2B4|nr:SDR family NAD(P)-dependent oxidoreductase [Paenibacillus sp. NEAU-GSW1]MUT66989.1 SDR family NAD(P)-dependent oxidoreductase [Paenibacillus sp. NEAU-GSW1]